MRMHDHDLRSSLNIFLFLNGVWVSDRSPGEEPPLHPSSLIIWMRVWELILVLSDTCAHFLLVNNIGQSK